MWATPRHLPFGLCHLASLAAPRIIHTLCEGATYRHRPVPSLSAHLTDVTGQWWESEAWEWGYGSEVESKGKRTGKDLTAVRWSVTLGWGKKNVFMTFGVC